MLIRMDEKAPTDACNPDENNSNGNDGKTSSSHVPTDEVRVPMNASLLQRLCGSGYYYYDDIPLPYKELLEQERILLPSQRTELERGDGETDMFAHLWIRFCLRLKKHQAEHTVRDPAYSGFFWPLGFLYVFILINGLLFAMYPSAVRFCLILLVYAFHVVLLVMPEDFVLQLFRGWVDDGEPYSDIQQLIDKMAPDFSEQGFNVDFVKDRRKNCPILYYIRFARSNTTEPVRTDTLSLAKRMSDAQTKIRTDYIESLITKRLQEEKRTGTHLFGCPIKDIMPYRQQIIGLAMVLAFLFVIIQGGFYFGDNDVTYYLDASVIVENQQGEWKHYDRNGELKRVIYSARH